MSLTHGNRRGARSTSWLRRILRTLCGGLVLGVLVGTAAPWFHGFMPLLMLFQHFAAQLGAVALFCLTAFLRLGMRRWALVALALTAWHGVALYPFLSLPGWATTLPQEQGPVLKVLSLNLWKISEQRAETVNYLLSSGADIIATVETTAEWRQDLKPLEAAYPYRVDCVDVVFRCGVALFSKLPVAESFADRLGGDLPTVVWARYDWQGAPLTVAALQLINPLIGLRQGWQAQQARNAGRYFGALPGDLVVMGDFNSAPWSSLQNEFRSQTGLDNRGRLTFTWPSWAPAVFRLPIDQIFTRGAIVARNVRAGSAVGSDHLPILAEIARSPH